jgi:hypothetical protein
VFFSRERPKAYKIPAPIPTVPSATAPFRIQNPLVVEEPMQVTLRGPDESYEQQHRNWYSQEPCDVTNFSRFTIAFHLKSIAYSTTSKSKAVLRSELFAMSAVKMSGSEPPNGEIFFNKFQSL